MFNNKALTRKYFNCLAISVCLFSSTSFAVSISDAGDGKCISGDCVNGQGIMAFYVNGDKYEGEWKNGKPDGNGILTFKNGDMYSGDWKNGKADGAGRLHFYENGGNIIQGGEWKNGKLNGKGAEMYNGKGVKMYEGYEYEGEWKENHKEGQGTISYVNGVKYKGEWKKDKPNGQGTMIYENGNKYEGELRNGKPNGQGTMTYKNGSKYEGEWKEGKWVSGQGEFTQNGMKVKVYGADGS
jgi:hypothetical protein